MRRDGEGIARGKPRGVKRRTITQGKNMEGKSPTSIHFSHNLIAWLTPLSKTVMYLCVCTHTRIYLSASVVSLHLFTHELIRHRTKGRVGISTASTTHLNPHLCHRCHIRSRTFSFLHFKILIKTLLLNFLAWKLVFENVQLSPSVCVYFVSTVIYITVLSFPSL